jgi:hypothetical protein
MKQQKLSLSEALGLIKTSREKCKPNKGSYQVTAISHSYFTGFLRQLEELETELNINQ